MRPASGNVRWCRWLAIAAVLMMIADWMATIINLGLGPLNLVFTLGVMLIFPVGWMAVIKAPPHLRRFCALSVTALVFQIIANALWYVDYLQQTGNRLPGEFGAWTVPLFIALAIGVAAAWVGVRDVLHARDALLDYSIVVAAAAAVGVAIIGHRLGTGWSWDAAGATLRALLSLAIVVIIGSAAFGRWQSLPVPVGLIGLSLLFDAAGFLWTSYVLSEGAYTNNRWPTMLWFTAAIIALLAGLAVIAGVNRPILRSLDALPGVSPRPLLFSAAIAFLVTGIIALHGALTSSTCSLTAGLGALGWIGIAVTARTCAALSEARTAYRELDRAHADLERAHSEAQQARALSVQVLQQRDLIIQTLEQRNIELAAAQTMLGPLLDIADEQSLGQLREHIEQVGENFADFLLRDRDPHYKARD